MTPRRAIWPCLWFVILPVIAIGCAGRQPKPQVLPPGSGPSGTAIARSAQTLLGAPYRDGGTLPDGFDCSGLVCYVFARQGVRVPRDVRRQADTGRQVARADIRAGDLLFFSTIGAGPTHVAIALDRDRFIHAPKTGAVVRVESLGSEYWKKRFLYARRVGTGGK